LEVRMAGKMEICKEFSLEIDHTLSGLVLQQVTELLDMYDIDYTIKLVETRVEWVEELKF
jgi:hypothetical protein